MAAEDDKHGYVYNSVVAKSDSESEFVLDISPENKV
jgi:hypothetical protein